MIPLNKQVRDAPFREVIDRNIAEVKRVGEVLGLNLAYKCFDEWAVRVTNGDNVWTMLPDWFFVELQRIAKELENKEKQQCQNK